MTASPFSSPSRVLGLARRVGLSALILVTMGGLSALRAAATLTAGDIVVTDGGSSASNTALLLVAPSTGVRTTIVQGTNSATTGFDFARIAAAASASTLYFYDAGVDSGYADAVFSVNPSAGTTALVSGGASGRGGPRGAGSATLNHLYVCAMAWDPVGNRILLGYGFGHTGSGVSTTAPTTPGVIAVDPTTGDRTWLTGKGVGSGGSNVGNLAGNLLGVVGVAVSPTGAIYIADQDKNSLAFGSGNYATSIKIYSVNRTTGDLTLLLSDTTNLKNVCGLTYDNANGRLLVSDATGIFALNPSTGALTTPALLGSGSSNPYLYATANTAGAIYYAITGTTPRTVGKANANGSGATVLSSNTAPSGSPSFITGQHLLVVPPNPPVISSTLTAGGTYGSAFSTYTITASNSPTSYSATGLPTGLSVNASNGQITGTPAQSGTFNVTISAINAGGTGSATLVVTINKAALTVTANAASRAYFASNPTFTASYSGLVNGDTSSVVSGSPSFSTNATSTSAAGGSYTITPTVGTLSATNYSFGTFNTGVLTITKVALTVTANAASRAYFASNPTFTASYSGFVNSETSAVLSGAPGFSTNATSTSAAGGSYTITPTIGTLSATNYSFGTFNTGVLTITKVALTVTANAASRAYFASNPTFTASYSGFVNSETSAVLSGAPTFSTNATSTSAAGGSYTITPAAGTLSATNYSFGPFNTGALTITKVPLTVNATAASRAYGASDPTFSATYAGFVNSETSAVISGTPGFSTNATATSTAGGSYTITPSLGSLSATNYSFGTFNTGVLTITKAPLTVTANAASRAYFAADPTFTASYTGFANGETPAILSGAPTFSTNATSTSAAGGSYTITPAAGTLSATNYSFGPFNTGVLTITKVPLTVTASAASRAYGAADPTFSATYAGFVNSETSAVVSGTPGFSTNATATSTVGSSYVITPSAGTLSATNYAFTTFNTGVLTITRAPLTVTANAASRTYGASDPTFTATYSGFVNGETSAVVSGTPGFSTNATATSTVGSSYVITPSAGTLSATNYAFTTFNTGVLTITRAPLTVTANAASRAYFASDPTFTASYSGFVNGETLAAVSGTPGFATNATATSAAGGSYTITPSAGSLSATNYAFTTFNTGVLTITKVPLTVTADAASRAYGAADPTFTATYTGFVNSETSAVFSGTPAFSTDATATSAVGGSYTITPAVGSLSATNYAFATFNTGTLTITKAPLTVTADPASRAYGAANPAFTATYTGFVNSETSAVLSGTPSFTTNATATSAPGNSYTITPAVGSLDATNYAFTTFNTGALTITKAALTVTANAASRAYFASDPTFTAAITGFANGETLGTSDVTGSPSFSTNAGSTSSAGGYLITPATGSLGSSNYSFNFATGALTITKVGLTVTANAASRAYGASDPAFTATFSGFVNSETASVVSGTPGFSTDATGASAPGSGYTITPAAGSLSATNYAFTTFNTGGLTITKATLTVTAVDASRAFGAANPGFSATYAGFGNGETLGTSDVTGSPALATTATVTSPAGDYVITAALGGLSSTNYAFTFTPGTLTIVADPRVSWRLAHFGTVDNTGSAADSADPDGDGLVNLLEYALDSAPLTPTADALPTLSTTVDSGATYLTLALTRNAAATDLTFTVEATDDLSNPSAWTTAGLVTLVNTSTALTVRDSTAIGASPRSLRLRVAPGVVTPPVGGLQFALAAGAGASAPANTYTSLPFARPIVWCSAATGVTSQTITVSGAGWTAGRFTSASHYVQLLDGALAGLTLDIVSQTNDTLTLSTASLSGYTAGMRFAIRAHATLASALGATNPASIAAATTIAAADEVRLYDPVAQAASRFYYKSGGLGGTGWRSATSTSVDRAAAVIRPDQCLLVVRKSADVRVLVVLGAARTNAAIYSVEPGANWLAITQPVPVTLAQLGLITGSASTGMVGDTTISTADELQRWTGAAWERLYYNTSAGGWRSSTDSSTDRGGQVFQPGEAINIVRNRTGEALFTRPAAP